MNLTSDLVESLVSHLVTQPQRTKIEMIRERALRSEVHHQTEWLQTDPHQFNDPGRQGAAGKITYIYTLITYVLNTFTIDMYILNTYVCKWRRCLAIKICNLPSPVRLDG